ncbi:MAG: transporter permease [Actinomycetota bacterium]|nr:transporter permease [Actinomycetota bacterium]
MPLSRRIQRALPNALSIGLTGLVMVILFGPVMLLALFSFNDSTVISLPWEGFTTKWYSEALNDDGAMTAIGNSVMVASIVTVVSLILGTLASWGLTRIPFRGRPLVAGVHGAVLVVPWLIIGVAGLIFFSQIQMMLSLQTIILMHIVVTFPLVVAVVSAGLIRFNPSLEEAAIDMGASQLQMMRYIVLPQIAPSLAAAAIFAFAWSFNNFEISFFTGGFEQTFPVWVYGVLRHSSNLPVVNAASTVIALAQVLLVFALWYGMKLMTRRRGGTDRDAADLVTGAVR